MGLMEKIMHGSTVRMWQKDAENVRSFLASLGPRERTQSRVNALAALAFIRLDVNGTEYEEPVANALQVMRYPEKQLSREVSGLLSLFLIRQMKNQKKAYASSSSLNQVIAAGIPIWVTSFRAVQKTELVALSRTIWNFLDDVNSDEVLVGLTSMSDHFAGHPLGEMLDAVKQFQTPALFLAH